MVYQNQGFSPILKHDLLPQFEIHAPFFNTFAIDRSVGISYYGKNRAEHCFSYIIAFLCITKL